MADGGSVAIVLLRRALHAPLRAAAGRRRRRRPAGRPAGRAAQASSASTSSCRLRRCSGVRAEGAAAGRRRLASQTSSPAAAGHHDDKRDEPRNRRAGREQDPVPVAGDEVVAHCLVGGARGHELVDLAPDLLRGAGRRIGHREALAVGAAQLARQRLAAFGGRRLRARPHGHDHRQRCQGQERAEGDRRELAPHRAATATMLARRSASNSSVSGPNCLSRTTPSASTKNVSGGPVTPKSIARRPDSSSTFA